MKKLLFAFILFSCYPVLIAQTITGKLVDQNNKALAGLQLQLYISPKVYNATSGSDGSFTLTNITDVRSEQLPTGYTVTDNYPNPFNPRTRIGIIVPVNSNIKVNVFNLLGENVIEQMEKNISSGTNYIDVELNGLPNGFYIANILINDKYSVVRKLMLVYGSQHLVNSVDISGANFRKSVLATVIDSLVVTGSSISKTTFKNLPNMIGNSLNLGTLIISIPAPLIPTLLTPINFSVDLPTSPSLSWNASSGATLYTLQVSTDNAFTSLVFNQSGLINTTQQVNNLVGSTEYFWRVCAANSYGTSPYSTIRSFVTIGTVPNPFLGTWKMTKVKVTINGANLELTPEQAATQMTIEIRSDASYKSTTTTSSGTVIETATWRINGAKFELYYPDGTMQSLDLTVNGNKCYIKTTVNALNSNLPAVLEFTKQ